MSCLVSGLQIIPGTDAGVTAGTFVPAAEGAPVEEVETDKVALSAGEEASLEEAKIDAEATEAVESDISQPEETEVVAVQVRVLVKGGPAEMAPAGRLCLLVHGDASLGYGIVDGLWSVCGTPLHQNEIFDSQKEWSPHSLNISMVRLHVGPIAVKDQA